MQKGSSSLWLASNPSKRWAEVFFLAYSPFWILWALCILVPFQLYEVRHWRTLAAGTMSQQAAAQAQVLTSKQGWGMRQAGSSIAGSGKSGRLGA